MLLSNSEPNKETQKEAKILSPSASATATINIYNRLVFNINLNPKETHKSEDQNHTN